jgi:hypothetical protein
VAQEVLQRVQAAQETSLAVAAAAVVQHSIKIQAQALSVQAQQVEYGYFIKIKPY